MLQFISRSLPLNIIFFLQQFWVLFSQYFRSVKELWSLWISNLLLFELHFYNNFPNPTNFEHLDVGSDQVKTLHYIWRRPPYGTRRQKAFQSCKFRSPCLNPSPLLADTWARNLTPIVEAFWLLDLWVICALRKLISLHKVLISG